MEIALSSPEKPVSVFGYAIGAQWVCNCVVTFKQGVDFKEAILTFNRKVALLTNFGSGVGVALRRTILRDQNLKGYQS